MSGKNYLVINEFSNNVIMNFYFSNIIFMVFMIVITDIIVTKASIEFKRQNEDCENFILK
ncbi:hypothetical protein GBFDFA_07150 [Edwardsiella anguillarum]|nr:hypothetical protein PBOPBF_07150 [Edwardsiella anguillarum]BET83902.1 hypothetical protein GHNJMD_07460 [Edwardsiella anguillarum]BET87269.1 hypothetical protein GBFDFA_07150 [Edwardsiella anguillarum]BET90695.1 hypothetical protein BIKEJJ_07155 [Edwardsiella anguillarum]GAJ68287.1 hypothetical protein MA13_contig00010-0020 [Edwardsiella piscicida]